MRASMLKSFPAAPRRTRLLAIAAVTLGVALLIAGGGTAEEIVILLGGFVLLLTALRRQLDR